MSSESKKSPLAPTSLADLPPIRGVGLAVAESNTRYKNRPDIWLAELAPGTAVAGVLTKSKTASAPIDWCRKNLGQGQARAIVVNAGNANAFTGERGMRGVVDTVRATAQVIGCAQEQVFIASTGVIGEALEPGTITAHLQNMHDNLSGDDWLSAATAIMTTDTYPKLATVTCEIAGCGVTINGIAKGSGMIAPDMATMLSFLFTDARIEAPALQALLKRSVDKSFNAITVDGDTSTSDTVLLCATGQAPDCPADLSSPDDPRLAAFTGALNELTRDLAQQIVKDGEGAQKFITINVAGAENDQAARMIGLSIGNSPLVKTAIAGEDANWGRIVMAVGKSGERADRDRLSIRIGGILVAEHGLMAAGYDEAELVPHMKGRDILIEVDVGIANGKSTVWTCDLTHGYIDINADYRS